MYINNFVSFDNGSKVYFFADHTVLYSAFSFDKVLSALQKAFDSTQHSLLELKLVFNVAKTKYMLFSRFIHRRKINLESAPWIALKLSECYYTSTRGYLSMKSSFKIHIDELTKELRHKIGLFYRDRSCFSCDNRKLLIQSTFLSVLDYGDAIYMDAAHTILKKLDAVYHAAVRFITGDHFRTHHCSH